MNKQSSGCYIIDEHYNIVNANDTALNIYPQLKIGQKCYQCLMGLDSPCPPCPVANNIQGPKTYVDPIRHISEIVDSVEIPVENHGMCHMLIFSTVANDANFAATLPTSAEELKNLALIKSLTSDYDDVLSLNINDGLTTIYRLKGKPIDFDSTAPSFVYSEIIEQYISKYVHPEDQQEMRDFCQLSSIIDMLKTKESTIFHYRVILNGQTHYYYRKYVRIGNPENFTNIVIGIGCEDEAIQNREKQILLQNTLRKVELNANTGLLNKEAFFVYGENLIKKYNEFSFDFCLLKIDNLDAIHHQYGPIAKNQIVQNVANILKLFIKDTTCTGYFEDGIFACVIATQDAALLQQNIAQFENMVYQQSSIKNINFKWINYKDIHLESSITNIYNDIIHIENTLRLLTKKDFIELNKKIMEQYNWDISVERKFENSLLNGEFKVWFQPKYSVHTKQIIGAEALVRWILDNHQVVPPDKFIPILENSGLINRLDEEVFRQVCQYEKMLMNHGINNFPISVNVSRASIFTRDIPNVYANIAKSYAVNPSLIPIEITESAAVRASMINEFASSLLENGFSIHMDDFGSGYSSLASLQMLPFECIKIDKSLVQFIGTKNGESILRHTISFAKETGLNVIAEGVELHEQLMFLKTAGCDAIQGYYFCKPVDLDTFLEMLLKGVNEK